MRDLLRNASRTSTDTKHNIRPKRKAATVSRQKSGGVDSDIDDSDTDAHYKCLSEESSSSDDASLSDKNNELEPTKPVKSSRKS